MMKSQSLKWLAAGAFVLALGALVLSPNAFAEDDNHADHKSDQKPDHKMAGCMCAKAGGCGMSMMMPKLKALLAEAKAAADAGDAKLASEKIGEAQAAIEAHQARMQERMKDGQCAKCGDRPYKCKAGDDAKCPKCGDGPCQCKAAAAAEQGMVVNATCPIMGSKLDRANVPENLTRAWNGKKVGFCCGGCPAKWDKLSDEQKAAKLAASMPE